MPTPTEPRTEALAALMQQAHDDPAQVPRFLRALLEATVYVHALPSEDPPRLRLCQFVRPDGLTVLPFFSDGAQAQAAAGDTRVVSLPGRTLLEATRGATLMLNPNGVSCTLFPEEIAALLDRNTVADLSQETVEAGNEPTLSVPVDDLTWLTRRVEAAAAALPAVHAVYQVDARFPRDPGGLVRLLVIAVPEAQAERAARAIIVAIQAECARRACSVDLTTFDPAAGTPPWLENLGIAPFYACR